jgi:hypothetical protein
LNSQPHCSLLTSALAFGSEATTILRISVLSHNRWLVIVVSPIGLLLNCGSVMVVLRRDLPCCQRCFLHPLCITVCPQQLGKAWHSSVKSPSLDHEFCCCMATGSLLLHFHWFIVEFSGNCHPPTTRISIPTSPMIRRSQTLHAQGPHRRSLQPTRLELKPVWVKTSASVSADQQRAMHVTSFTGWFIEFQASFDEMTSCKRCV